MPFEPEILYLEKPRHPSELETASASNWTSALNSAHGSGIDPKIRCSGSLQSRRAVAPHRLGAVSSDVEVGDVQRVGLDEVAARLDDVAHQLGEDVVGVGDLLHLHLQQRADVAVERRLPELLRVHLAETLVALKGQALASHSGHGVEQAHGSRHLALVALAGEAGRGGEDVAQRGGVLVELAGVG